MMPPLYAFEGCALEALAGPVPVENAVANPRARAGTNAMGAIARTNTSGSARLRRDCRIVFSPFDPQTTGREGDEQRAHCSFGGPANSNESRSFASLPHGRFAFVVMNKR